MQVSLKAKNKILVGNWKMYLNVEESLSLLNLNNELGESVPEDKMLLVLPSAPLLLESKRILKNIPFGAQDMSVNNYGAYTGDLCVKMLKEAGAQFILLGHSERRKFYAETDKTVGEKMIKAFCENLTPIICVGESETERADAKQEEVVLAQLETIFNNLETLEKECLIAYEPIWAIGTGNACQAKDAVLMHQLILNFLEKKFGQNVKEKFSILYGGSVNADNMQDFCSHNEIDGALVGGASVKEEEWRKMVDILSSL